MPEERFPGLLLVHIRKIGQVSQNFAPLSFRLAAYERGEARISGNAQHAPRNALPKLVIAAMILPAREDSTKLGRIATHSGFKCRAIRQAWFVVPAIVRCADVLLTHEATIFENSCPSGSRVLRINPLTGVGGTSAQQRNRTKH